MLQVRGAAAATAEREARALAALERSGAERNAAAAARERLLQEREDAVSCTMHGWQQSSMPAVPWLYTWQHQTIMWLLALPAVCRKWHLAKTKNSRAYKASHIPRAWSAA
jgi:hypothetical protein